MRASRRYAEDASDELTNDGCWVSARKDYLVPVKALSMVFWGVFVEMARRALPQQKFPDAIWAKQRWIDCRSTVREPGLPRSLDFPPSCVDDSDTCDRHVFGGFWPGFGVPVVVRRQRHHRERFHSDPRARFHGGSGTPNRNSPTRRLTPFIRKKDARTQRSKFLIEGRVKMGKFLATQRVNSLQRPRETLGMGLARTMFPTPC